MLLFKALVIAGLTVFIFLLMVEFMDWKNFPVKDFSLHLRSQIKIDIGYWCFIMLIITPVLVHLFGV